MKKLLTVLLALIIAATCSYSVFTAIGETVIKDDLVVSLFDGTKDEWLDNQGGALLEIKNYDEKTALTHAAQDSSISLKRKFSTVLKDYSLDNLYIIADIYIDGTISDTCNGTLKIKNGDGADPDNPSENNQLNFAVLELGLKPGWNSLELSLKDAIPDGGDDYTIADWFCIWLNDNDTDVELSIGKLDIINRKTEIIEDTTANETPTAPKTSDIAIIPFAIMAIISTTFLVANKKCAR